jgi:V8-like Glu-specific endopeptidase
MKFQPNYYDGERLGSAYATVVYHIPTNAEPSTPSADPCFWKEDWAIMILDQRLGDKYGYLGAKIVANDQLNRAMFFNFGYPGDKSNTVRPWRQEQITIRGNSRCEATGPMDTDADIAGGNSGGPLWLLENGSRYQYAMCSAGGADVSIHSGGNNWLNAVINLRKDQP